MPNKQPQEMSVIELKALLFDIENEIKQRQNGYQQIGQLLEKKIAEEKAPKEEPKVEKKTK